MAVKTLTQTHKTNYTIKRETHTIDATGVALGRLASDVARKLMGKTKPTYEPNVDHGDFVIIENADKIKITGKKLDQKKYYSHSQHPGNLKTALLKQKMAKNPSWVITKAVTNMLPKNKLQKGMLKRLTYKKTA